MKLQNFIGHFKNIFYIILRKGNFIPNATPKNMIFWERYNETRVVIYPPNGQKMSKAEGQPCEVVRFPEGL